MDFYESQSKQGVTITFPVAEDLGDGMVICDIGHELTDEGYEYGPAVRGYYLIHVITKGHGKFLRAGKAYELSEGDAFLIRPMEVTLYGAHRDNAWEYFWIGFKGDKAKALAEYAFPDGKCTASVDKHTLLAFLSQFKALHRGEIDQLMLRSTLYSLLSGIRKSVAGENHDSLGVVEQALKHIEANYFRPISISALAEELGVTRPYLTSLFTAKVGDSPYNYATKLRIEQAKKLIENGKQLTASEVAYSVGFASLERFSEMFKKYVGVSPQAYKKSLS